MQCWRKTQWAALLAVLVMLATGKVQAATQETNMTTVAVNIAESIAVVSWPEGYIDLARNAVPGEETISPALVVKVKANSPWGIEISSDLATGRMREYDLGTGTYLSDGASLTHPLQWATSPGGPWTDLSSTPSSIVSSQPPTGEAGKEVLFYLRLLPDYGDKPLGAGREYRILLRYTVGLNY
ncbi:MAG: hypothetical protein GX855_07250 [Firmicutes bacterium]|nr:hypothetical protein [Bacillota bacterium]